MLWKEKLDSFLGYIFHIFEWVVRALLIFITLLISMQVFLRAAFEYSIMMQQYEALLADYQRREAEEQAEKAKAQEGDGQA